MSIPSLLRSTAADSRLRDGSASLLIREWWGRILRPDQW